MYVLNGASCLRSLLNRNFVWLCDCMSRDKSEVIPAALEHFWNQNQHGVSQTVIHKAS